MSRLSPTVPALALGFALVAQQGSVRAEPAAAATAVAAPVAEPSATPAILTPAPQTDAPTETRNAVEVMPASAFPEPKVRGLRGGSLWLTFHGLQWPYYPKTGIGVSGSLWMDNGYRKVKPGATGYVESGELLNQSRGVVRVTPTFTGNDWFVQGQAEIVGNSDQTQTQPRVVDFDDLWVRTGSWKKWDLTVGRFEGWEVYHYGMALDLNTQERTGALDPSLPTPQIYGLSYAYLRPNGLGNVAFHAYPTDTFRVEALVQTGAENGNNSLGGRGVGIFDLGWLRLKGGGEYIKKKPISTASSGSVEQRGWSGSAQFIFEPWVEFGLNGGYALQDVNNAQGGIDKKNSVTVYSLGGFVNFRPMDDLLIGTGLNLTDLEDIDRDDTGKVGHFTHLQTFGALQYVVHKQLFVKLVLAYAKSHMDPSRAVSPAWDNTMTSARVRVMYLF